VRKEIISAVKRVEFDSDRILRGRWCHIIVRRFQCQTRQGRNFKPKIVNKNLHEISDDDGLRLVNFATSNDFTVKSMNACRLSVEKSEGK
jgi:hypothetical protein